MKNCRNYQMILWIYHIIIQCSFLIYQQLIYASLFSINGSSSTPENYYHFLLCFQLKQIIALDTDKLHKFGWGKNIIICFIALAEFGVRL
jgi:hypothetical protein